jgi:hypothetical protein
MERKAEQLTPHKSILYNYTLSLADRSGRAI